MGGHTNLVDFYATLPGGAEPVPDSVTTFPGMTAAEEKGLLYRLARGHYRGEGVIVDAGLFLGASTNAFGTGLRRNADAMSRLTRTGLKPITAYEIAIWSSGGFDKYLKHPHVQAVWRGWEFADGDNYLPALEALLEPHRDLIEFRIGDIEKTAHEDRPIEIAFYDCLKNAARDSACFKAFAPRYIPGHTVVIQQDYFYEDALDNKIRQEFLSPYFRFLGSAATSAAFQLVEKIPDAYFEEDPVKGLSIDQCIDLLDQAAERVPLSAFHIYAALAPVRYATMTAHFNQAADRLTYVQRKLASRTFPPRAHEVTEAAVQGLQVARERYARAHATA